MKTWRVSEEEAVGDVVIRLEILDEPTSNAVGRSLGKLVLDVLSGGLVDDEPSYVRTRVVRIPGEAGASPQAVDMGHDYPAAQAFFASLVAEEHARLP